MRKRFSTAGSSRLAGPPVAPMRTTPLRVPSIWVISSVALRASVAIRRARRRNASPKRDSTTPRVVRVRSGTCSSSSSWRMLLVMAGADTSRALAPARMLPLSATAMKSCNWLRRMTRLPPKTAW
ncbi:hypothetical protein D3C86_1751710 [compost metagenome]